MAQKSSLAGARAGVASEPITEALYIARPEWRHDREFVDELEASALYVAGGDEAFCLVSCDVCEFPRAEAGALQAAVADALDLPPNSVHVYCTHTHSASLDRTEHDLAHLKARMSAAALRARAAAEPVADIGFLRVDVGDTYAIHRRTPPGPLGSWCLMQSQGCTDDGTVVDGAQWVRDRLIQYGATPEEAAAAGSFPATRPNDPNLDMIQFVRADGACIAGLARFTAHPVVCSANYWKPNLGRDYPGVLRDRLAEAFNAPFLFLQGPCGDHRPRHRDVGIAERDRIGTGLAEELVSRRERMLRYPFDTLSGVSVSVPCALRADFPASAAEARALAERADAERAALPPGAERLRARKDLYERAAFLRNAAAMFEGHPYLLDGEPEMRCGVLPLSRLQFGPVRLLNYPGELLSTVTADIPVAAAAEGPVVVASYADGVAGYLVPGEDMEDGGYETTWAFFDPGCVGILRHAGLNLLRAG